MAKSIAIFQEKSSKTGKFIGLKIYYYLSPNSEWYFVTVGKPLLGKVPEYTKDARGQWMSRKQYPTVKALEKYHKADNIHRRN